MSSAKYVADLQPDPLMRRVVLLTALLAGAAGILVLYGLPIDPSLRVLVMAAWVVWLAWNARQRRAAERQLQRIRLFADGTLALLGTDGRWTPATVAAQSTVLDRLAWLQFNLASGRSHAELLRGNARESKDWRRLQVIWRHRNNGRRSALGSSS